MQSRYVARTSCESVTVISLRAARAYGGARPSWKTEDVAAELTDLVADAAHRCDHIAGARVAELVAQPGNVRFHEVACAEGLVAPQRLRDRVRREHIPSSLE